MFSIFHPFPRIDSTIFSRKVLPNTIIQRGLAQPSTRFSLASARRSQPTLGDPFGGIARLWKLQGVGLDVSLPQTGQENVVCRGSCGTAGGDISLDMASRRDEMEILGHVWFQQIFIDFHDFVLLFWAGKSQRSVRIGSVSTKSELDPDCWRKY